MTLVARLMPVSTTPMINFELWLSSQNSKKIWKVTTGLSWARAGDYVVYLGWPIAPLYMSPNAGGGGKLRGLTQWVQLYKWSPNKLWRSNSIFNLWARGNLIYEQEKNVKSKILWHCPFNGALHLLVLRERDEIPAAWILNPVSPLPHQILNSQADQALQARHSSI